MKKIVYILLAFFICLSAYAKADKPNIIWLTSEDNAAHYMSFMGDKNGHTPNLDSLASRGVVYERAYSNGPVCAVARSTLITGAYASTTGTFHMRSRYKIPAKFKTYPEYLREAGYYCTNNVKTDYNIDMNDKSVWDDCSKTASFKNRPNKDAPFFAVFNFTITHESNLFPKRIAGNKRSGTIPAKNRVAPKDVKLAPYYPDTEEIRSDIATYYDCMTAMDKDIAKILEDLKADGAADNTIIFYFSDHGGILPREKRYLEDTGTHVPFIIYAPEKWAKALGLKAGSREKNVVSFVDAAPTVLSLAGIETPKQMEGVPFLGKFKGEARKYAYLYNGRFDGTAHYSVRRAITDGDFRYIRDFYSFAPYVIASGYAFGQEGWKSWQKAFKDGKTNEVQSAIWVPSVSSEKFYYTKKDAFEIKDASKDYPKDFERLKAVCKEQMLKSFDAAILPEAFFFDLSEYETVYDFVRKPEFEYARVFDMAWSSGDRNVANLKKFKDALSDKNKFVRYWAIVGLACLGDSAKTASADLEKYMNSDSEPFPNRVLAAIALSKVCNSKEALNFLEKIDRKFIKKSKTSVSDRKVSFYLGLAKTASALLDGVILPHPSAAEE